MRVAKPPQPLPEFKKCPFCAEQVRWDAVKCKHCGSSLPAQPALTPEDLQKQQANVSGPPSTAIWSLVLSIVSLFCGGFVFGIPGVICGHLALSNIRKNLRPEGRGIAVAGLTIGYVSMALWLVSITLMLGLRANTTAIAKSMRVQADLQEIKTQLQLYEAENGFYPTTEQGLQALVTQPQSYPRPTRWSQLLRELPKDPWGNDYIYRSPGVKNPGGYDLFSAGPDRQPDTADDDWGGG